MCGWMHGDIINFKFYGCKILRVQQKTEKRNKKEEEEEAEGT